MNIAQNPESFTSSTVVEIKKSGEMKKSVLVKQWCSENWRSVFGELLSTFLLISLGCMSCVPITGFDINPAMYTPLTFGLLVMFNIQSFGHISGAHMNPAVTVAAIIWGSISVPLAALYVIAQCGGAILGYWMLMTLSPVDLSPDAVCATLPRIGLTPAQAFGIEVLLTSALVFVNCGAWDPVNQNKQDSIAMKFGLTVAALSFAGGPLTGASMNPARSLGPALMTGAWTSHWVYWTAPFVGGTFAVLLYKYFLLTKPYKSFEELAQGN